MKLPRAATGAHVPTGTRRSEVGAEIRARNHRHRMSWCRKLRRDVRYFVRAVMERYALPKRCWSVWQREPPLSWELAYRTGYNCRRKCRLRACSRRHAEAVARVYLRRDREHLRVVSKKTRQRRLQAAWARARELKELDAVPPRVRKTGRPAHPKHRSGARV